MGTSCHDIRIKQQASKSGLYLIHPPNVVQGPWKVFCDQESDGGGWTVSLNGPVARCLTHTKNPS